jgi:hypothetical protein
MEGRKLSLEGRPLARRQAGPKLEIRLLGKIIPGLQMAQGILAVRAINELLKANSRHAGATAVSINNSD